MPPTSAPLFPPNIATHPAATHPTNGIELRVGAAAAPTLVPTRRPVPSAPPIALIHSSVLELIPVDCVFCNVAGSCHDL